ncbi:MAG: PilZ domain-containing protein [Pseudomonadota bacterium]
MGLELYAEQREEQRVSLMFHAQVLDCTNDKVIGILADISVHGMRVVGERSIAPGNQVRVRVPIPVETRGCSDIYADCECRWSRRDVSTDSVHNGFRVVSMDPEQSHALADIIDEYGITKGLFS